jgi:recombinational DNA repair protein (RecF pathway)
LDFSPDRLARIALGGVALAEARQLVRRFLRFHVGIDLRSAPFLERMLPDLPVAAAEPRPPIDTAGG